MKMRLLCTLILCGAVLYAQPPAVAASGNELTRAQQDIQRLRELVAAGAIAPARLQDAEQVLGDAQDAGVLDKTLYGKLTVQDLTEDQTREMIAAAERRLGRQKDKIQRMQKLVDAGVLARGELEALNQEMESRRLALDLAQSRARLLTEIAEMARREEAAESASSQNPVEQPVMEHYEGDGAFTTKDLKSVELAFERKFGKPLPISANGETSVHRALGFDHRGRVDVAVSPDQTEGVWLRTYLEKKVIPYYAFRTAVPGKATGAHIHIGPGSTRLRVAD